MQIINWLKNTMPPAQPRPFTAYGGARPLAGRGA